MSNVKVNALDFNEACSTEADEAILTEDSIPSAESN